METTCFCSSSRSDSRRTPKASSRKTWPRRSKRCATLIVAGMNRSRCSAGHRFSKRFSQMSRNPLIEAIHEARYDLDTCAAQDQAAFRKRLEDLVAQALARTKSSAKPRELLDILYDDYKEFRRLKRRQEWPKL